jgi:hypothetical protein
VPPVFPYVISAVGAEPSATAVVVRALRGSGSARPAMRRKLDDRRGHRRATAIPNLITKEEQT